MGGPYGSLPFSPTTIYLIGEEYEQKRKAFLKYNNNDVVRTTEMLDASIEFDLLGLYGMWIDDSERHAGESNDQKGEAFFKRLRDETYLEYVDVSDLWNDLGVSEERMEDATWEIISNAEWLLRQEAKMRADSSYNSFPSSSPALSDRSATPHLDATNAEEIKDQQIPPNWMSQHQWPKKRA